MHSFNVSDFRKISPDIRKRTDCPLNVKEPRGGPPRQMWWLCRKHRSTGDRVKAPPPNACHTCLTTNLGIGFWNRLEPRLLHHHRRRGVLRWQNETAGSTSDTVRKGRDAVYVRLGRWTVRVMYRRWNRLWDREWLIIRGVGTRIIRRCPCPWCIIGWSTGVGATSCGGRRFTRTIRVKRGSELRCVGQCSIAGVCRWARRCAAIAYN